MVLIATLTMNALKGILGELVVDKLKEVFPIGTDYDGWSDEILGEVDKIIAKSLKEQDIKTRLKAATNKIAGFSDFMNISYAPKLEHYLQHGDKKELKNFLETQAFKLSDFHVLLTQMKDLDIKYEGLGNYILAVDGYITLLWHYANLDEEETDPTKTTEFGEIKTILNIAIPHIRNTAEEIRTKRLSRVGAVINEKLDGRGKKPKHEPWHVLFRDEELNNPVVKYINFDVDGYHRNNDGYNQERVRAIRQINTDRGNYYTKLDGTVKGIIADEFHDPANQLEKFVEDHF